VDALTLFGLFAVIAMLVCYALEDRSPHYVLGFRGNVRARVCLRLSAGRVALRRSGDHLGRGGVAPLAPADVIRASAGRPLARPRMSFA
jgi:hypothetical protein